MIALLVPGVALQSGFALIPLLPWCVVAFFVNLSLAVRRLHDSDRTGFWYFIGFVPYIGLIWLIILLCMRRTPGPNRYDQPYESQLPETRE